MEIICNRCTLQFVQASNCDFVSFLLSDTPMSGFTAQD